MELLDQLTLVPVVAGVVALFAAAGFFIRIRGLEEGNETMRRIAGYIREGAMAFLMALAGCDCRAESGPATLPCAPISHSQVRPSSWAFALFITTTAQPPSEI